MSALKIIARYLLGLDSNDASPTKFLLCRFFTNDLGSNRAGATALLLVTIADGRRYHVHLFPRSSTNYFFSGSNYEVTWQKVISPRRNSRQSLLPHSHKRTQVRLKSVLQLVWLSPDFIG